ncbi:MAG TPA: hypothetical protein VF366_00330 [Dehalococcoidia bacterium]|jgi:hypothetical protein
MMQQPQTEEKQPGVLERLPKLGRVSQLILIVGVFVLIFVPLLLIYQQQEPKQNEARASLSNTQKILSAAETPQAKFEAQLAEATATVEAARASFPKPDQAPEIIDTIIALAAANDIIVTRTSVSSAAPAGSIGPVLTFVVGFKGQIPKFQNFLLGLDSKLPTSEIKAVSFIVAKEEGDYDSADVTINVLCYASD